MPQSDLNSAGTDLCRLLPYLYYEQEVGILSFRTGDSCIRLHLNGGLLVHADGLDFETPFLREIARSKGLSRDQLKDLLALRGEASETLGLMLLERNLVTPVTWDTFIRLRARHHLSAALAAEGAAVSFEAAEVPMQPLSSGDQDLLEVLAEVLREVNRPSFFKRFVAGPQARFQRVDDPERTLRLDLLNGEERGVLSLVKGGRTIGDMTSITGMDHEMLYRNICVLLFLGMVTPACEETKSRTRPVAPGKTDYAQAADLYVAILESLRPRVTAALDAGFEEVVGACLKELKGPSRKLFEGVGLGEADPWLAAGSIRERYEKMYGPFAGYLILSSSFNKLLFLMILQLKQALGARKTIRLIDELQSEVARAGGEGMNRSLIEHITANLKDIRDRILS
ncbi:MAG: hypothetical protein JRH05_01130 [Deltaproteobacteria bacterium]|nr:hypothetical protein [Deltaproteobacteria bacterium]